MQTLYQYAMSFLGTPYVWGGQSFFSVDCSGLILELLESVGLAPKDDLSAQGIMLHFMKHGEAVSPQLGALAFFGRKLNTLADTVVATHVGFCVDEKRMIEAYGGSSFIDTPQKAKEAGACVKMSMISRRSDLIIVLRPRYELNGFK